MPRPGGGDHLSDNIPQMEEECCLFEPYSVSRIAREPAEGHVGEMNIQARVQSGEREREAEGVERFPVTIDSLQESSLQRRVWCRESSTQPICFRSL